jgi:hypothetical protein
MVVRAKLGKAPAIILKQSQPLDRHNFLATMHIIF